MEFSKLFYLREYEFKWKTLPAPRVFGFHLSDILLPQFYHNDTPAASVDDEIVGVVGWGGDDGNLLDTQKCCAL